VRERIRLKVRALLAVLALSDVLALVAVGCTIRGLALITPIAAWLGVAFVAGIVSVELGKQELKKRGQVNEDR
jgi:hypothetical protein